MNEEKSFIDQLIEEAEEREQKLNHEMADLMLREIRDLNQEIEQTFEQVEKERTILKNWGLTKTSKLTNKVQWLSKKLELFLKEEGVKTLELAFGTIKFRKQPDRVEIIDEELFLNNATSSMLTIMPETAKADMNKIKTFIKRSGRIPQGCELVHGEIKFSYSINNQKEEDINGKEKTRATNKQPSKSAVVV